MSTATVLPNHASDVLAALAGAVTTMEDSELAAVAWRLSDADVTDGLSVVGRLRQALETAEVTLAREGVARGLPEEGAWTAQDWVARAEGARAPTPEQRHVARVVRVARSARVTPDGEDPLVVPDEAVCRPVGDDGAGPREVCAAFVGGDLPLTKTDQLLRFNTQLTPLVDADELAGEVGVLLEGARDETFADPKGGEPTRVHGLTEKELATAITLAGRLLKPVKELDDEDRRARKGRSLTKGPGPAGLSTYKLTLDPEGAAILDAAIEALAEPVTGPNGEPDERSAARRRADALLEVISRGVSSPGEAPKTAKAQVLVTISLSALQDETGCGGGVAANGEVLSPSTVRRMACDAGIIPVVLGDRGEVLELGRAVRWFTPAQKRAIWLRDRSCTYPGCTVPGQWCDAHHVEWWSRGGRTDVTNGALLCGRHHTHVHEKNLTATITDTQVTWHE